MSFKMTCPGCSSHTSDVLHAFEDDEPCPVCDLPASAASAVLAVRESRATETVRQQAEAAELRAGRAEAELAKLRLFVEDIRELLERLAGGNP